VGFPFEFRAEVKRQETRVMGLLTRSVTTSRQPTRSATTINVAHQDGI